MIYVPVIVISTLWNTNKKPPSQEAFFIALGMLIQAFP